MERFNGYGVDLALICTCITLFCIKDGKHGRADFIDVVNFIFFVCTVNVVFVGKDKHVSVSYPGYLKNNIKQNIHTTKLQRL